MSEPKPHERSLFPWFYSPQEDAIADATGCGVVIDEGLCDENAAFIVHACNSHARLVAESARMRAALERIANEFPVEIAPWVVHAAKQALENAP